MMIDSRNGNVAVKTEINLHLWNNERIEIPTANLGVLGRRIYCNMKVEEKKKMERNGNGCCGGGWRHAGYDGWVVKTQKPLRGVLITARSMIR